MRSGAAAWVRGCEVRDWAESAHGTAVRSTRVANAGEKWGEDPRLFLRLVAGVHARDPDSCIGSTARARTLALEEGTPSPFSGGAAYSISGSLFCFFY